MIIIGYIKRCGPDYKRHLAEKYYPFVKYASLFDGFILLCSKMIQLKGWVNLLSKITVVLWSYYLLLTRCFNTELIGVNTNQ